MLYKYHHAAVGLRINYLASRPKGAETHTVLVTDIPGIRDGTYVDRAAFILPKARREKLNRQLEATAAKATGTGTGVFGRIWYSLMYVGGGTEVCMGGCMGVCMVNFCL